MEFVFSPEMWPALGAMTVMQIVLGVDNLVVASAVINRLPEAKQNSARKMGLVAATLTRLLLLVAISRLSSTFTAPLFSLFGRRLAARQLVFLAGGLFLLWDATGELHKKTEGLSRDQRSKAPTANVPRVILQVALVDMLFSLDNVATLIGMSDDLSLMIAALMLSAVFLMLTEGVVTSFVQQHPSVHVLTLSVILLIGTSMVAEGMRFHIPRAYIYFAVAFATLVEVMNLSVAGARPSSRGAGRSGE